MKTPLFLLTLSVILLVACTKARPYPTPIATQLRDERGEESSGKDAVSQADGHDEQDDGEGYDVFIYDSYNDTVKADAQEVEETEAAKEYDEAYFDDEWYAKYAPVHVDFEEKKEGDKDKEDEGEGLTFDDARYTQHTPVYKEEEEKKETEAAKEYDEAYFDDEWYAKYAPVHVDFEEKKEGDKDKEDEGEGLTFDDARYTQHTPVYKEEEEKKETEAAEEYDEAPLDDE